MLVHTLRRVRLLPCVNPLVPNKVEFLPERLLTLGTGIGLFPCVRLLVTNEVELLAKPPTVLRAQLGLLPSVCLPVSGEERLKLKGSSTLGVQERFYLYMNPLVPNEVDLLGKSPGRLATHVRLLPCMCLLMSHKGTFLAKALPTIGTNVVVSLWSV